MFIETAPGHIQSEVKIGVLQISLAFEHCVGYSACFVLQFYRVAMRVKGPTQNSMFKRK